MKCFFSLEFVIINTTKILQESMMYEEEDDEFIAAEMEQYEKYYIYKGMLAKIQDSLADEMITVF